MSFTSQFSQQLWEIRSAADAKRDADLADRKRRGLMPPPHGGCGHNTCCGGIWLGPSPQCDPVGYKAKIDAAKAAEEARMVELKAKFDKQRKSVAKAAASTEWQLKFDKHRETAAALVGWQAKASVKKSIAEVLVRDALQREATAEAQALTAKAQNEKELAELFMPQPLEPSNLNEHPKKGKAIPAKIKAAVWKNHFAMSIKGTCFCCKSELDALHSWHAGHIVARSKGGLDIASNLRPVCGSCNQSMGAENMDAFKARFYPY